MSVLQTVPLTRIDGAKIDPGSFAGKVVLVVNVASKCGLTPQYERLEAYYRAQHERGFVVLGFPSNQFHDQEPGSNAEIATFCGTSYGVSFPLFEKIDVNGPNRHPLYRELVDAVPTALDTEGAFERDLAQYGVKREAPGDVLWNFEKFLIARDGRVVARFAPDVTVDDAILRDAIEHELQAT